MRKIKFRGRKKYGKWLYGDLIQREGRTAIRPFDDYACPFGYKVESETVGQFTGFTDALGQELYDGDLLVVHYVCDVDEPDETEYRVVWDEDEGAWAVVRDRDKDFAEWLNKDVAKQFVAVEERRVTS